MHTKCLRKYKNGCQSNYDEEDMIVMF
jgi:hypothetical protein